MLNNSKEKKNKTYDSYNENDIPFLNFPTSSQPDPFEKYQNYHSMNKTSYQVKARNKVKGNFLERNYKISKTEENQKMMNERELNSLFYKLKNYYNEILNQNKKELENINYIKSKINKSEKKISDYERAKEVESGTEKISGLDTVNNIDNVINKIKDLKQQTEEAKFGVTNENEYASTLKYLMEDSKSQFMKINEETLIIQQKLHDIKQARKILKQTINNRENSKIQSYKINTFFENQIEKVNEMLVEQEYKKMDIEKKNKEKEDKLEKLKSRYNNDKKMNKYRLAQYKEETLDRISNYYYQKEKKEQKEKNIINFIVGFHFFQKYFINKNRENKEKNNLEYSIDISECKKDIDFNNFMKGEQYELFNPEEEEESSDNSLEKIKNEKEKTDNVNNKTKEKKKNKKKKKKFHKITFEDVKQRFDELDLKYDEFYDYYTKIISKANFSQKKMTDLNERFIYLEAEKKDYAEKVDEIILKDYKNLIDLIEDVKKFDEDKKRKIIRFTQFLDNNKNILKNAEKLRNNKAIKRIIEIHNEDSINPDATSIKKLNDFITKCKDEVSKIKFYFEAIFSGMRDLKFYKDNNDQNKKIISLKEMRDLTTGFTNKCNEISKEKYIKDLLNYSIEKKIYYSDKIYNNLFQNEKPKDNMKLFLKDNLTEDKFIFYLFKDYDDRIKLNSSLNDIINYYNEKMKNSTIFNSTRIINNKVSDKNLPKVNRLQTTKQTGMDFSSIKRKDSKKGRTSLLFFIKPKEEKFEVEKKKNLEDEINGEYNYEKTNDDNEDYNFHKIIRPKTTKLTTSKRIVQQLYEPSLEKSEYLRKLNYDLNNIKTESSKDKKFNSKYFRKTWNDLDNYENQFYVYNNPSKIIFILLI